jgi:hypothetical protein
VSTADVHIRVRPATGWEGLAVRELWEYRELAYFLVWRDLKVRYKQTVIGAGWALLQPVLPTLVFTVVFGFFAKFPTDHLPYPIFAFASVILLQYFTSALTVSSGSLVANVGLITKVYFPRLLLPLGAVGTPLVDLSQPMPFTAVQAAFDPLFPRDQMQAYWKSQYLDELSDAAIDVIAAKAHDRPAPLTMVNTFHMGGALRDVGPEETAFSERSPEFMVSVDGLWTDPAENDEKIAWVRATWDAVREFGTGGVYLNFTGLGDDEAPSAGVDTALGRNLRRLAEIKAKYDPDNFFRRNNNIAPAT